MDEKKVESHCKQQSNLNDKIKDSTEIFVLSPLFLQNLGISIKDITQETSFVGTKEDDANVENIRNVNNSNHMPVSKKIQQDETSIVETANLMKNSVFMSPTFVPPDNNDSLQNVNSQESGVSNNSISNEKIDLKKKFSDGTAILCGAQTESLYSLNVNDICQKNVDSTQSLIEYTFVSRLNNNLNPLGNTGPNDYVNNNSTTNEQSSLQTSILKDEPMFYNFHINNCNSQNEDSDVVFAQKAEVEKMQEVTCIDYHQESKVCSPLKFDEVGQKSNKRIDYFENSISYSEKINTEHIEPLSANKESELISDDLIQLNELVIFSNNNIMSNIADNGNMNDCAKISILLGSDLTDFEDVDSLHPNNILSQNNEEKKNVEMNLVELNDKVLTEKKLLVNVNEDLQNINQNDTSVYSLNSRNSHDTEEDIEGVGYGFSSNITKDKHILKSSPTEKHVQVSLLAVDAGTESCQCTSSYHSQCNKEVNVVSGAAKINKTDFLDDSKMLVLVPSEVKNIENGDHKSVGIVDHVEQNKLKDFNTSASSFSKIENKYLAKQPVQVPNFSLSNSFDKNSGKCNISETEISYTANSDLDYNPSVLQDKACITRVSESNIIEIKKQPKNNKAVLYGKKKDSTIRKRKMKMVRNTSKCESENINACSSTHKNQCFVTESNPDAKTNVNLIASYLKKITQMHSQGQKLKTFKKSKKMISKLSVQGVEKPGGSKQLIQKQDNCFHFNTSNLNVKKIYNRKRILSKQTIAVNPIGNKIYDVSPCNYSLDYTEKPVSVDVAMGFCICMDYGHVFYDNDYADLEHLHYQNKVSDDFNIRNFATDQCDFDFDYNKSLSDEISEPIKDVTETSDTLINSICWKNIEELIEEQKCKTDEKNQTMEMNNEISGIGGINMSSNKCIESTERTIYVLNSDSRKTMDILKMADSETSLQQTRCLDPKVGQEKVPSNYSIYEIDFVKNEFKTSNTIQVQKLRTESGNSLVSSNSDEVDNSVDEKIQIGNTVGIISSMTVTSKRPHHVMTINDENDSKKLRLTVNDSAQNNMNTNSDQEVLSHCPEFLPCDVCKLNVKTEEWINHKCSNNSFIFEDNGNLSEISDATYTVPRFIKKLLKKTKFLKCPRCGKNIKCAELYLIHVNKCSEHEKVSAVISEKCMENQGSKESNRKEKLTFASDVKEEDSPVLKSICGVCYKVMDRKNWVLHIQKVHNYLAWQKGETPIDFSNSKRIKEHLVNMCKTVGPLTCKHCGLKQKRYRRSHDKYIDVYLDHVEICGNQLLGASNVTNEIQDLLSNQDYIISKDNSSGSSVNESILTEANEKVIEIEENFVCGVCGQAVESAIWMEHIQTRHNYLAWKKGEPEIDVNGRDSIKEHLIKVCKTVGLLICKHCGLKQKRYRRSYDRYIDVYLDHVELCANQVSRLSNTSKKLRDSLNSQDSVINSESNISVTVNYSTVSVIDDEYVETKQNIICGVCEQVFDNREWLKHIQNQHNYLAWKKGDPELDLNNSEEIESYLVELTKNIGSLICYKCETKLKRYKRTYENYIKSFLKHVEECSNNAVRKEKNEKVINKGPVSCAVCLHKMDQNEWDNHLLHKHYNLAWRMELDEPLDLQNTAVILRQLKDYNKYHKMTCSNCNTSRISILGFFAHIVTCQKTEEEIAPFKFKCEICGASSLKVYYQQHMAGHKAQELNEEKKKLRLEAAPKEEEFIIPVSSGKRKAAHKAMAVLEKYKATACKYKCNLCEFRTDYEQELSDHKCDVDDTSFEDSDESANLSMQSSDESSDEVDENLSDEQNEIINKKKPTKEPIIAQKSFTVPFSVKNVDTYLKIGCNKFMELNYTSDTLFDEWRRCQYTEVQLDEVQKYLPPLAESCKIKFDSQWTSYKRFEAKERKGYCLFTGGCISCMAWVPGPADAVQLLAVATYNSIDIPRFSYDTLHEHPGFIQIWSCGSLGDNLPVFSLGILHDFGTVWSMEWCPSGARLPLPEDPYCVTRLGLLAVACSNGLAYIFSVPYPSSLPNEFYKLHPAAELRLWTSSDHPKHQATSISWSKQKGHSIVAVGYSNGTTAMFDLNCDSPILKQKEDNTTVFYPYSDDYSVNSSITGISMYPTMEEGNRTTGLEVIGCSSTTGAMLQVKAAGGPPHTVYSKMAVNGADFILHWPALFVSMDDNTPTKPLSELEVWGVGRRAGGARAVAACVCCPRLFTWAPPLVRSVRTHPLYSEIKRSIIAAIEMVPLSGENLKPKKQKVDDDLSLKVEPTVYEDAILKYGVRFQFINSDKRQRAAAMSPCLVRPDLYPLAEVCALAVCPSPTRHNWLAIGLHAGFVLIIRT